MLLSLSEPPYVDLSYNGPWEIAPAARVVAVGYQEYQPSLLNLYESIHLCGQS